MTQNILTAAVLFLLNAYVCRGLFGVEYLRHMGSIEGAYIGISRYMLAHWRDFSWFPAWYAGIPAQNTYPPLLHWMVALGALLRGISPAQAHHWVTAILYCLGPVTLFALARRLGASLRAAFFAGAIYSTLSPSAWLIPAIGRSTGQFHPERLTALVLYGEGPHITALTLLPLAILFLDLALERRRPAYFAIAVLSFASVPLSNWLGAFALALCVLAYVLARGLAAWDIGHTLLIAAAAYCLALPWIPPSTIAAIQHNAQWIEGDFSHTGRHLLLWTPVALIVLVALKLALRQAPAYLQFVVFFTFLAALPPLAITWAKTAIVPQPERYHLEMEMAIALLAALLFDAWARALPRRAALAVTAVLLLALVIPMNSYRRYARDALIRGIDITTTSEWRTAQWLNQHWDGSRVMLPGSSSFWLTAFSDVPEIGGGFAQGLTLPVFPEAMYELGTGEAAGTHEADIGILWLKALGVHGVAVSGPGSTEIYRDFRNPKKFEGTLPVAWRDGGDVLYRVGPPSSLAHVMASSDLVIKTPVNGIDVEPLRPYVAALDNRQNPTASFEWTSLHSANIQTDLPQNSAISIQISWSAGWHARVNGRAVPLREDGLGFMYIVPEAAGPASIAMYYDGGLEMIAGHWISITTLILLVLACFIPRRFQRWPRPHSNFPPTPKSPPVPPGHPSELSR